MTMVGHGVEMGCCRGRVLLKPAITEKTATIIRYILVSFEKSMLPAFHPGFCSRPDVPTLLVQGGIFPVLYIKGVQGGRFSTIPGASSPVPMSEG